MSFSEVLREYLEARERLAFGQSKSTPSQRELEAIEALMRGRLAEGYPLHTRV